MKNVPIEKVKKGDFFKLSANSSVVYVMDGYNRDIKKYEGHKFTDISAFTGKKKGTIVYTDFEF
jgi:hypothetical protein